MVIRWKDAFEKAFLGQPLSLPDVTVVVIPHSALLIKAGSAALVRTPCARE